MLPLLLSIAFLMPPSLDKAAQHSLNGDYEASESLLGKYPDQSDPKFLFYKLVNSFKLNKKKDGLRYADLLIHDFRDIPYRYRDMAVIMRADMETWKDDADDLGDISREMDRITDRLKNAKGGKKTQEIQKEVLARLEKMIKDAEDKQKAAQDQAEGDEAKKKAEQHAQQPQPAQDVVKGTETGTGKVDQKKVKELAEVWGKLPEKERARALVELTRSMPKQDKMVIEAYFRELQKKSSKK